MFWWAYPLTKGNSSAKCSLRSPSAPLAISNSGSTLNSTANRTLALTFTGLRSLGETTVRHSRMLLALDPRPPQRRCSLFLTFHMPTALTMSASGGSPEVIGQRPERRDCEGLRMPAPVRVPRHRHGAGIRKPSQKRKLSLPSVAGDALAGVAG